MSQEQKIGRYIVKSILGEGAMGRVLKCYDPNLERWVAIKIMRTTNLQSREDLNEFKDRFFQEARVSGRLNHPNIVGVYDSGLEGSEPYLVMEFIDGRPLDAFVKNDYAASLKNYLSILEQTASALDFAHEEEVIHRDVKPGNILISPAKRGKFRVTIVDFGLAKLKDSKITQPGFFLGTPSYSSPEQIINGRVDARSDVYSLGTVAYEMLTRTLPFDAESLHAILYQIANEPPRINFSAFADQLDAKLLETVFIKVFHKDPGLRFQSAREFYRALKDPLKDLADVKIESKPVEIQAKAPPMTNPSSLATQSLPHLETMAAKESGQVVLIEQARSQFKQAYRTRNLSSVRYCLRELRRLGADVTEEEAQFKILEAEISAKGSGQVDLIAKARSAFKLALNAKNLHSSRYCLNELRELGADVDAETRAIAELEQQLSESERAAKRTLEIESVRGSFQKNIALKNVAEADKALAQLKAFDTDCQAESKALDQLRKTLKERESQRQSWVLKVRSQFAQARQHKNADRCRQLIRELEELLKAEATEEKKALAELEAELEERELQSFNQHIVDELRNGFQQALSQENLKEGKRALDALVAHGVEVATEKKALKNLQHRIREREAQQLKDKIIAKTQENFQKAIKSKNLDRAQYYLKELRQLVREPGDEEQAIAALKKQLLNREAEDVKANVLRHLRDEFTKAIGQGNLERSRYYLKELEINQADIVAERARFAELEGHSNAEEALHQKMIREARVDFQNALSVKNGYLCEHYLGVLAGFSADVAAEIEALQAMKREEEACLNDPVKKAKWVERLRYEFLQAFKSENIGSCRYFLEKLEYFKAESHSESEAVELLSVKLRL